MKKLEKTVKETIQILEEKGLYNLKKTYQRYIRRIEETRRYATFKN